MIGSNTDTEATRSVDPNLSLLCRAIGREGAHAPPFHVDLLSSPFKKSGYEAAMHIIMVNHTLYVWTIHFLKKTCFH